jgi:O-methyltransferase involved in polyketide biosynthesis
MITSGGAAAKETPVTGSGGDGDWMTAAEDEYRPPVELHTDQPHSARMYDYLLGGKDNYTVDREAAEKAIAAFPLLRTAARENRRFVGRAVKYLVENTGIRQFIDLGSGLPTAENVHQVAQRHDPLARVVYVDHDPIVLVYGQALLDKDERTAVIHGDIREPEAVLNDPGTRALIDFDEPVAVLAVAVMHFIGDEENPAGIMETLRASVPSGSHFVLSHATADLAPEAAWGVQKAYRAQGVPLTLRSKEQFAPFFDGLEPVEPGIQVVSDWHSTVPEDKRPSHADVSWYGGIGRLA